MSPTRNGREQRRKEQPVTRARYSRYAEQNTLQALEADRTTVWPQSQSVGSEKQQKR